jgi:hypothetical protein
MTWPGDGMKIYVDMPDGLYRVIGPSWVGGFIVYEGWVRQIDCAPVMWRSLPHWAAEAELIDDGDR